MKLHVTSAVPALAETDWLVVLLAQTDQLTGQIASLDNALGGAISAVLQRKDFAADAVETLCFYQPPGIAATNLILAGLGKIDDCDVRTVRHSLLAALRQCCKQAEQSVTVLAAEAITAQLSPETFAEIFGDCVTSAPEDADVYKSERSRHPYSDATLCIEAADGLSAAIDRGVIVGDACRLVRNLVNRPANILYPETFAAEAVSVAEAVGIQVRVFGEQDLVEERMGALLAVAQGSSQGPRMVQLSWDGTGDHADGSRPELALVGKGVTFDSGGYAIKPVAGMLSMKADMAGAATVLGAIVAAARLRLPIKLTAWLGLVENMISGSAYRLGDVLTARNGTTIEIQHTDAEGRLVLADVLAYAVDQGAQQIVDLATLTGACVVALGEEVTGMFSNNRQLADTLTQAADSAGEFFWPLPMHKHFEPLLKSSVADCRNIGPRWGGAVTAAKFLEKFVGDTPWVHLDIAGPAWADSASAWQDAGGTASPLRAVVAWLRQQPQ